MDETKIASVTYTIVILDKMGRVYHYVPPALTDPVTIQTNLVRLREGQVNIRFGVVKAQHVILNDLELQEEIDRQANKA